MAKRWTEGEIRWKLVFRVLCGYLKNEYDVISNIAFSWVFENLNWNTLISVFEEVYLPNLVYIWMYWQPHSIEDKSSSSLSLQTILDIFHKFFKIWKFCILTSHYSFSFMRFRVHRVSFPLSIFCHLHFSFLSDSFIVKQSLFRAWTYICENKNLLTHSLAIEKQK